MNILIIGAGAREHAIAWKLKQSSLKPTIFSWPSSAALESFTTPLLLENSRLEELISEAKRRSIELIIVGPEQPLAEGIVDMSIEAGIPIFGPDKASAQLESSKEFAKELMKEAKIPTANFQVTHSYEEAQRTSLSMLEKTGGCVLKASGLAGGKGVFVCQSESDVNKALERLKMSIGQAADTLVIEEILHGRECSFFCLIGNNNVSPLGFAVDFKRLKDGDKGPNTGGMGCYTPVPWLPRDAQDQVMNQVVYPLMNQLKSRQIQYQGFLYVGLMWGVQGPQVVEFNVRLGDPEAQVLAVQDQRDWLPLICTHTPGLKQEFYSLSQNHSSKPIPEGKTVGVVIASQGYPFNQPTQTAPTLDRSIFQDEDNDVVFGASITGTPSGYTPGAGRVLTVVSKGSNFDTARSRAYQKVDFITGSWPNSQFRTDIGLRLQEETK